MGDQALPPLGEIALQPLVSRPLGFGDVLSLTIQIYRSKFLLIIGLGFLSQLPGLLITVVPSLYLVVNGVSDTFTGTLTGSLGIYYPLYYIGLLVSLVTVPLTAASVVQATVDIAGGGTASFGRVFREIFRRYFVIWLVILVLIACAIPMVTICLIPLGLWLLVSLSLSLPAMFAEGIGPMAALRRSWDLVRGNWWRVFGITLLAYVVIIAMSFFIGLVANAVLVAGSATLEGLHAFGGIVGIVVSGLTEPIPLIITTLLYFDCRLRREALLQAAPPEPMAPPTPPVVPQA